VRDHPRPAGSMLANQKHVFVALLLEPIEGLHRKATGSEKTTTPFRVSSPILHFTSGQDSHQRMGSGQFWRSRVHRPSKIRDGRNMMSCADLPTWLTAIGTVGAVIVALYVAGRDERRRVSRERRHRAEQISTWLGPEGEVSTGHVQNVIIQNSGTQPVYRTIASLVSVQGAFRETAVGDKRRQFCQNLIGTLPPGRHETKIEFPGHAPALRFGVELAFRDAAGHSWIRSGDGSLKEVEHEPAALYGIVGPTTWESS
jgi:hypothetical protein